MFSESYLASSKLDCLQAGKVDVAKADISALSGINNTFPGARYFDEIMLGKVMPKATACSPETARIFNNDL